tara:strand:+ start:739 stop:1785 length:1047 start_codon:yes stop_codon:yes gene_type:complete
MKTEIENAIEAGLLAMHQHRHDVTEYEYAVAVATFPAYGKRYETQTLHPVAVEQEYRRPVIGHAKEYIGFVDTIMVDTAKDGQKLIHLEHKSGARDADSNEIIVFNLSNVAEQPTFYDEAADYNGERPSEHIYDYIKVCGLKPKRVPKGKTAEDLGTLAEIRTDGKYLGEHVSFQSRKKYEAEGLKENGELYGIRVAQHIAANPDKYFSRKRGVLRTEAQREEARQTMSQVVTEMERAKQDALNGMEAYYKNTGACFSYGSYCEYLPICEGKASADSDLYQQKDVSQKTVSYSRMGTWKSCRQKYKFKYLDGIQPVGKKAKALRLGSLIHLGLEVFYEELMKQELSDE